MAKETNIGYSGVNILTNDAKPKGKSRSISSTDLNGCKEITRCESMAKLEKEISMLLASTPNDKKMLANTQLRSFTRLFQQFLEESSPSVDWNKIEKLPVDAIRNYDTLQIPRIEDIQEKLEKLVVVKLNGGVGTSMGCRGPKSLIQVRNDLTFLDLSVQQIEYLNKKYNVNVPLVLMNSFNTNKDTEEIIHKYKRFQVEIYTFNQSCFPRVAKDSLLPIAQTGDIESNIEAWYTPGHGDFYESFKNSGLLQKFIQWGREYCFISNIDNLGATVDLNILNMLLSNATTSPEFLMEVTNKTKDDIKGGTLIQYENKLRPLEIAQVPKEHLKDFKSVKKFQFFNTNNLWIKLNAIENVLNKGPMQLEIIVNNKILDNNLNIIQLETAVSAAMKYFNNALGINVPRSRFIPVKTTSDLLLAMSNLYNVRNGSLYMNHARMFSISPLVKLDDENFAKIKDLLSRFSTIPDVLELDHLTVSGDVTFGSNVSLKGTVIIIASHGERIDIPANTTLENNIVSGNLRILDY